MIALAGAIFELPNSAKQYASFHTEDLTRYAIRERLEAECGLGIQFRPCAVAAIVLGSEIVSTTISKGPQS